MNASSNRLPIRFETDRLILRSYVEDDAAWYYQMSLRNREHLRRYESGNVAMSLTSEEHTRRTLGTLAGYWEEGTCYFVGVFLKSSNEFVAQIYVGPFCQDPIEFIIGYMADCDYEGYGYVTEAVAAFSEQVFERLKAESLRIHCDETNTRSRRVAERCGFQFARLFPEEKKGADGTVHACTTAVYLRGSSDVIFSEIG